MTALDTNILIYSCDKADAGRQEKALDLISNMIGWSIAVAGGLRIRCRVTETGATGFHP